MIFFFNKQIFLIATLYHVYWVSNCSAKSSYTTKVHNMRYWNFVYTVLGFFLLPVLGEDMPIVTSQGQY